MKVMKAKTTKKQVNYSRPYFHRLPEGKSFFNRHKAAGRSIEDLARSEGEVEFEDLTPRRDEANFKLTLKTGHALLVKEDYEMYMEDYEYFTGDEFAWGNSPKGRLSFDRKRGFVCTEISRTFDITDIKKWWLLWAKYGSGAWSQRFLTRKRNLRGVYRLTRSEEYMRSGEWSPGTLSNSLLSDDDDTISISYDPFTRRAKFEISGWWAVGTVNASSYEDHGSYRYRNMVSDGGGEVQSYLDCLQTDEDLYSGYDLLPYTTMQLLSPKGTSIGVTDSRGCPDSDKSEFIRQLYAELPHGSISVERWFNLPYEETPHA